MESPDFEFYNCDVIDLPSDNEFPVELASQSRATGKSVVHPKFSSLLNCDVLDLSSSEDEALDKNDHQSQSERALCDLVSISKNARLDAEFQQMLMYSGVAPKKSTILDEEFRHMLGYDSRRLSVNSYSHEIADQHLGFEHVEDLNYNTIDTLLNSSSEGASDKKRKNKSTFRKDKIKEEKVDDAYVENNTKGRPKSTRRTSAPIRFGNSPDDGYEFNEDLCAYNESYLGKDFITVAPKEEAILAYEDGEHVKQSPEKRHVCEFCLKRFRNAAHLREHRRIHTNEKPFRCERCNRGFRQRSHLKAHLKRDICTPSKVSPSLALDPADQKERLISDYRCEECGDSFTVFADLKEHRHTHNENKPYECEQCGLGFDQEKNFVGHQKTCSGDMSLISTSFEERKGPPYICEFCKKEFRSKGHLRDHRRIHTNERPFQCLTCPRAFKQTSALRSHMKICKGDKTQMKTIQNVENGVPTNGFNSENFDLDWNDEGLEFNNFTSNEGHELTQLQTPKANQSKTELTGRKRKFKSAAQIANNKVNKSSASDTGDSNAHPADRDMDRDDDFDELCVTAQKSDADSSATEIDNEDYNVDTLSKNKRKSTPRKKTTLKFNISRKEKKTTANKSDANNILDNSIKQEGDVREKRPFACAVCNKTFKKRQSLREHIRLHTQERPYTCTYCDESFLQHNACMRHMQRIHSAERLAAGGSNGVDEHKLRISKLIDEVMAQFGFDDDKDVALKYTIWTSSFCGLKDNHNPGEENKDKIAKILAGVVQEGEEWKCTICESKSRRRHILVRHVIRHFDNSKSGMERAFFCEYCGRSFKTRQHFNDHRRTHTGERPYQCRHCSKRYITMTSVREHEVRAHKVNPKPFKCPYCPATFRHQKNMDRHTMKHITDPPEQKIYQCEICSKTFKWSGSLKMHTMYHLGIKPYVCKMCPAKFVMKGHLVDHIRSHSNERPYQCHICGMSFKQRSALTAHKVTHTGKSIECTRCTKMFHRKKDYEFHMMKHNGIQPFACDICGERFIRRGGLTRHKALHTDPNRFECNICHKNFKSRLKLDGHAWFHQNGPRFYCDQCDVVVPTKIRLDKHKFNKHSNIKNFACRFCDMRFKGGTAQRLHEKSKHKKEWENSPYVHEPPRPPGNRAGNRQQVPKVPRLEHPMPQNIPPPVQLPPPQENVLNLHQGLYLGNHMGWDRADFYGV